MFKSWFGLTLDAVLLGFETQRVIGLRLAKIAAGGPAAQVEAHRMVMEKTTALGRSGDHTGDRRLAADRRSPLPHARQGE
jgi:hypothetical protein